jgi:hypothetical protein
VFIESYLTQPSGISCLTFHSRPIFRKLLLDDFVCDVQFKGVSSFAFNSFPGIQNSLVSFHHCYSF